MDLRLSEQAEELRRELRSWLDADLGTEIGCTRAHDGHRSVERSMRLEGAYGDGAQHRERMAPLVVDAARHDGSLSSVTPGWPAGLQVSGVAAGSRTGGAA